MGCDIHLFVERKIKGSNDRFENTAFCGEFSDRNYNMFAFLADVRNYDRIKHMPLRGLPNDIGHTTFDAFFKRSVDDTTDRGNEKWYFLQKDEDKSVKTALSFIRDVSGVKYYLHPDFHSYNWCTASELSKGIEVVRKKYDLSIGSVVEWLALASYMTTLEENGVYAVRAVYCFDN